MRRWLSLLAALIAPLAGAAAQAHAFTHADTLRGSNTPQRAWWDVSFYDLHVSVDPRDSTIRGWNAITYRVLQPSQMLQVDLQHLGRLQRSEEHTSELQSHSFISY